MYIENFATLTNTLENIKQNEKNFFLIKKSEWDYSVDIFFKHTEKINISNLYYILKSYTYNTSHLIKFFLVVSCNIQNEEDDKKKINVCHYVEYEKIKKMSMIDFEFFYKEMYDNDYNYIAKDQLYGFRVVFFKESFFWKNGDIYPIYPWKNSAIYKDVVILYEKNLDINLNIKFKKLKLENEKLRKRLKKIPYKNIWRNFKKKKK